MSNKKYINIFKVISFDIKSMGILFAFPFIMLLINFLYCLAYIKNIGLNFESIIFSLEAIVPTLAAWWTIFSLQDCLEQDGRETIFTYAISRYKIGILRTFIFFLLYSGFIAIFILLLTIFIKENIFLSLFLQLVIEAIFFYSFGFLSMTIIKNSEWSIFVILAYTITQIMSSGKILWFANVYYFNKKILSIGNIMGRGIIILIVSSLMLIVAQYKFNKIDLS